MPDINIILPSKPRVVSEDNLKGTYEIDGLYPGYGHTLGNSLRRIILSSLPGAAVTSLKIDGVPHEFSTIAGVKEDVILIILNIKKLRFKLLTDEPQTIILSARGPKKVTGADMKLPGQVELANPDVHIAELTEKSAILNVEVTVERGLGYIPKEVLQKDKVDVGVIAIDAAFTPIQRVNYEVEAMRVGTRTDFNRLRILIETDGTLKPREALEKSIEIMINQLKSIVGFRENDELTQNPEDLKKIEAEITMPETGEALDPNKIKIEDLNLSTRTANALNEAGVRTVGGLSRKTTKDILGIPGLGEKGLAEIRRALSNYGITINE